jgi:hypothetical protein
MGYVILRTKKLKSGHAVRRSLAHAFREQDTPNADPTRASENSHIGAKSAQEALARFNARLPEKVRSNAVLGIEYLISSSPEDMRGKSRKEQDAYFKDALKWLQAKHGKENVVYAGVHRDETTPHLYAYVVPIDERGKLNCRHFLGGAKALTVMQTEFFQAVGKSHGLQRGVEGSKARHTTIKEYYTRVNAAFEPLPEVKTPAPSKPRVEPEKPGMFASKDIKAFYERDFAKWEAENAAYERQRKKHLNEVKAQRDAAVSVARQHQAKAMEANSLKLELDEIKSVNSYLVLKNKELAEENKKLGNVLTLFRPEEVKAAALRERKRIEMEERKRLQTQHQEALEAARRQKQEPNVKTRDDEILSGHERDSGPRMF